jgi:hypothetical protein
MKLTDENIATIIAAEEQAALDYEGELSKKRAKNLDYYNCQPFGDEIEGQSPTVTSDVSDVVEWMLPSLIRIFTQGKLIAKVDAINGDNEKEAEEKTHLANYYFMQENNGLLTLYNMFKDALLQYTGVVKVSWEEPKKVKTTKYAGLSKEELLKLQATPGVKVDDVVYQDKPTGREYDANKVEITESGKVCYYNVPPEEFVVAKSARDFINPSFIGHRSPKTRSDLLEMGFDKATVVALPADDYYQASEQKAARYHDFNGVENTNPSSHSPKDTIYLGEYYIEIDVDGDGITELWKVFFAGNKVLEKEQVEEHPFAVVVPIPIPHRAIGSCPAEQVADIQYRKSTLVRQMLDNIYQSNYPRVMHSNKVELDDLLTPRAGGTIEIDTNAGDVAGHAVPLVIPNMIEGVMSAIEYTDQEREIRTGITRYSQGLDGEALNKTATGFKGIMDASQQRLYLVAALFAGGGVKQLFEKTISTLAKYQDTGKQIKALGQPMEINPKAWGDNSRCVVNVGMGGGDRQERILNLNNILSIQERYIESGLVLADQSKIFNTLEKLVDEVGLKEADEYFNNPEVPEQLLMAKLEMLFKENLQLKQQAQVNPLAEAELIKAKAKMAEVSGKENNDIRKFVMKMAQDDSHFRAELARGLTELELKYQQDVPGAVI